jgi:nucleoporin SEH1
VASEADYVHDVSYNYYGTRLAICTSSQAISIWDQIEGSDESSWKETSRISHAHSGPIWRLDWAHPEFGQVIASCSEDRTICIWHNTHGVWKKRATLTDSPYSITDVQFAPRQFGLKLGACTADGMVRVYEAADPLNLSAWEVEDFSTVAAGESLGSTSGCTALSWAPRTDVERLGVSTQSGKLKIYEKKTRWTLIAEKESVGALKDCAWAPNLCREHDWIAVCGDSAIVTVYELRDSLIPIHTIDTETSPIWRCAWSLTGDILSVAPESGKVQLWRLAGIGTQTAWERLENKDLE